jgi:hypothetical protein
VVETTDGSSNQTGVKMKALFKGIYDKYSTVNDFSTAVTRFHLNSAPQSSSKPYAVFQLITNNTDYDFTSTFDESEIQIDIIDDNNDSDILDLADKCMALFDDCDLTVAGYQFIKMERDFNALIEDPEEEIQRYMIQYTVWLRK